MRRASALVVVVLGLILSLARAARAEGVLLLEPDPTDAVLFDARNRLAAELRLHHFDVESIELTASEPQERALVAEAGKRHAVSVMALARRGPLPSVDVWLVDRATGKVTHRTLEVERATDAASVLAIRAVDLVRASLHEPTESAPTAKEASPKDTSPKDTSPKDTPTKDTPTKDTPTKDTPTKDTPTKDTAPTDAPTRDVGTTVPARRATAEASEPRVRLRAEALIFAQSGAGLAVGPSFAVSYLVTPRFEVGVGGAGPVLGGHADTTLGRATLDQELAWLDLRFTVLRARPLDAGINAAAGAYFLGAEGEPNAPLHGRAGRLVAAIFGAGVHADVAFTPAFGAGVAVRVVAVAPRAGIAVGSVSTPLELPAVVASAGIRVAL